MDKEMIVRLGVCVFGGAFWVVKAVEYFLWCLHESRSKRKEKEEAKDVGNS